MDDLWQADGMSIEYSIICDGCHGYIEASSVSVKVARERAAKYRTCVRRGAKDYHPSCVPKEDEAAPN